MLLANPQVPWDGRVSHFEAHIVSPSYSFYGATLVGLPVLIYGFNDSLGWTMTVNTLDACDLYDLVSAGKRQQFSVEKQIIKVRNQGGNRAGSVPAGNSVPLATGQD